VLDRIKAGQRD